MNVLIVLAACVAAILAEGGYPSEYGHGSYAFNGHYGGRMNSFKYLSTF